MNREVEPLKVGIVGLGAIGKALAMQLEETLCGVELNAVTVRDSNKAQSFLSSLKRAPVIVPLDELAQRCDIVIECAPAALLADIGRAVLSAGKKLVVLSSGALLSNPELIALAKETKGQILIPTGALLGLDAVTAAAEGTIHSVRMVTRKPVKGLLGAPYLESHSICIDNITEATRVFNGTAREAAVGFPANLNVAVALSLAGIGPDQTMLEIWADPDLTRNTHRIHVEADSASFTMSIENIPSENPKTGRITALSVISLLRKMSAPLRVGS